MSLFEYLLPGGPHASNSQQTSDIARGTVTAVAAALSDGVDVQCYGRPVGPLAWPYETGPDIGDEVCIAFPPDASGSGFIIGWTRHA
jgi:hypothetical protein